MAPKRRNNGLDDLGVAPPPAVEEDLPPLLGGLTEGSVVVRREPTRLDGIRRPDSLDPAPFAATPRYRKGDENQLAYLSPEAVARLQQRLAQAGLIGPSTRVTVGVADDSTVSAYRELLGIANRYGMEQSEALDLLRDTPTQSGGTPGSVLAAGGAETGPTTSKHITVSDPTFTDPEAARQTLKSTWEDMFGRAPTEHEYRRYAAKLRKAEAGRNRSVTTTTTDPATGVTRSETQVQDDTTDLSPAQVAEQMASRGGLEREGNTRRAGVDYYAVIDRLIGGQ